MKKLRLLALILIVFASGLLFSACEKNKINLCEEISLSENSITLQLGETMEVGVQITPEKATNKLFELVGDYVDVGCNSVCFPGTIIKNNTSIYPLVRVRGVIEDNSIMKSENIIVKREER